MEKPREQQRLSPLHVDVLGQENDKQVAERVCCPPDERFIEPDHGQEERGNDEGEEQRRLLYKNVLTILKISSS